MNQELVERLRPEYQACLNAHPGLSHYSLELAHISQIRVADSVITEDKQIVTVCPKDLCYSDFMGVSLFGDTYHFGRRPVARIIIPRWYQSVRYS